ncbi:MAG: hypothetical protein EBU36_06070, partial [Verrucomicrobia bacterium]|nr:hypothetical protein [Verrucomicrobiota bacterium]
MYMRESLFRFWMGRWPRRLVATALILFACSSADASVPGVETGPTNSISGLTQTSVKLMGGITNLGGTTVTNAGFFLNTNSTATNGVKYSAPGGSFLVGPFSNTITGLTPGTSYYYRAFAANSFGTGYGASEYSFTTPSPFTYTNNGTGLTITGYTGGGVVEIPATIGGRTVTAIGNDAFKNKTLTAVTIPEGVTTIGSYAFAACSMTAITLPNSLRSIEDHAFENNGNMTAVTIPEGVTTMGAFAFAGCGNMTVINLPNSLTSIGIYAFQGCAKLTSIIIPNNVTRLGGSAFESCSSLTRVTLSNKLENIETGVFYLCSNLASITIPNTVTNISANAFKNSSHLATVNFLQSSPPAVASSSFSGVVSNAIGYYPTVYSGAWSNTTIAGLTLMRKLNQTITFNTIPVKTQYDVNVKVVLDARVDSGLPLSFVSNNDQVATVTTDAQVTTVCNLGGTTLLDNWAMGLAVDALDNVYVAAQDVTDGNNQLLDKILKISAGTADPQVFLELGNDKPRFLATHDGYLYVTTNEGVGKVSLTGGSMQYLQLKGADGSTPFL